MLTPAGLQMQAAIATLVIFVPLGILLLYLIVSFLCLADREAKFKALQRRAPGAINFWAFLLRPQRATEAVERCERHLACFVVCTRSGLRSRHETDSYTMRPLNSGS